MFGSYLYVISAMEVPKYAVLSNNDKMTINYLCNIRNDKDFNIRYFEERKTIVMRNCDESGNLMDLKSPKHRFLLNKPWVLLKLKTFEDQGEKYEVPICKTCNSNIDNLCTKQSQNNIMNEVCHHSKIAANIIRNFSNPVSLSGWLELSEDEEDGNKVEIIHTKQDKSTKTQHLAVAFVKKRVSILYTTGKQTTPTCSSCSGLSCQCVRAWQRCVDNQNKDSQRNNIEEVENNLDDEEVTSGEKAHYRKKEQKYGHNSSPIIFPLHSCPKQKTILDARNSGSFKLPEVLIPDYDPDKVCDNHGYRYKKEEMTAKCCAEQVIIYHERGETVHNTRVYYRVTDGGCKCRDEYDGHEYLLFHMGGGKMVDYISLQSYLLSMVNGGTTAYAYHKTISDNCKAMGNTFSCNYKTFLEACDGFVLNLKFDEQLCFTCTNCGKSPKYFVGDGKANIAPLQRKLKPLGIKELSSHPDDTNVLSQGSVHEDRIFLDKKERDGFCNLLTGGTTVSEFCSANLFSSQNAKLLLKLLTRIKEKHPENIPDQYHSFITDVCKNSPIAGYMQVTSNKPLILLRQFCVRQLDVRSGLFNTELYELRSQLPVLWQQLVNICEYEDSNFLPHDISGIVLALLNIRKQTFRKAPQRYAEDYIKFDESGVYKEDPTQFYPMHELKTYPKQYKVNKKIDTEFCEKNFPQHHDFADGIFSIGCCCELSITYGFEIMMAHESARHFFKFLMNRKLNLKNLEGVIFDFACNLHRYALNREPEDFEHLRFLVDGSHYQGMKKLKRQDSRAGKKGHLGCNSAYNFNVYKQFTKLSVDGAKNSQGREQMHSSLDKLAKSLRKKYYHNFM